MWNLVTEVLSAWAPVQDREAVDGSQDSIEKVLEAVSSPLPNKAALTAAGSVGWIFLTALKVNMDQALHDAEQVCNVQRCLEELAQCIVVLEQEPCDPEEPSISDSEVVRERYETNKRYKTVGPRLLARPIVQQKDRAEEAWMLWKAKEKTNGTDSAVRMKCTKAGIVQGLSLVEREKKGKGKP